MSHKGVPNQSHKPRRPRRDMSWQEHAACIEANPRIFFDPTRYAEAQLVCLPCPVKAQCSALGRNQPGVWGGRVHEEKKRASV